MTIVVRRMTPADLPAVWRLEQELFPEDAWSLEMLQAELDDQPRTRHYVVAVTDPDPEAELVGYAGLAAVAGQADVQTIGVRTDHQGCGVGATLLASLLEEADRRHCDVVFLEVRADNDRAQRLYRRFGFTGVSVRKCYYQPSGVDAIVMCRPGGARSGKPEKRVFGFGPSGGVNA